MDLWLARLVLIHHHLHRHHQLPSATLPGDRVRHSFLLEIFFSGMLTFALVQWGLELLSMNCRSLFLSRYSMRMALFIWPTSPPSGCLDCCLIGVVVGLSLVLRLLASTELRLYRTSLPYLMVSRIIRFEWTWPWWSPSAWSRMSFERIVGTSNLLATLVTLSLQLWNLTVTALEHLVWGKKAARGFYDFSKGHEPDGKTNKPTACHLMPHNKHLGK
jgi:hypothetical protein